MSVIPVDAAQAGPDLATRGGDSSRLSARVLRRPVAVASCLYLAAICGIAIAAPLLLPGIDHQQFGDFLAIRQGPTWRHLLGTDSSGRDVLDRLLVGTRVTLVGDAEFLAVVVGLGVPLGLAAGYLGGRVDRVISWLIDLTLSIPALIVVLVVFSLAPNSLVLGMTVLGILTAPQMARVVRSATLPVREEPYVAAARVSGLSSAYIIRHHVFPRVSGAIVVQGSFLAAAGVVMLAALSYLGFGVAPPAPSWGGMLNDGISVIVLQPWLIWPPTVAIALTVLALALLGDVVRDATVEVWSGPVHGVRPRRVVKAPRPDAHDQPVGVGESLLAISDLGVSLALSTGGVPVVEQVSFNIGRGETVGLVGESGCGKTVTAMTILGLIPGGGEITSGRIMFEGRDLASMRERELRRIRGREIGFVSQEPMASLNPTFRIGWQVADVVRRHNGLSRRLAYARAIELLERVQLREPDAVARRYPHEVSGGMAQRVAIARALAGGPKLLIADEPTTALDVTVQSEILELLRDLQRERAMSILLVSHDLGVVADLCDRVVIMYAGQVVESGDVPSVFREPRHPYTAALLASNPHVERASALLPTIPGAVPAPGAWPAGCHFHPRCRYATAECRGAPVGINRLENERETRCVHHDQLRT